MDCSTPGFPILHYLPEFAQIHVHCVNDAIQPSHSLSSPSLAPSLSQHQGLFQWVSSLHQVDKVLELQHQSFNEYLGLISFRIDWFDLPAVRGTPKSLFQHHSLKASTLWCLAIFMVQLSWKGRKIIYAEGRKAAIRWNDVCIATSIKMRLSSQYKLGRGKVDQILTSSDTRMRAGKLSDEQPKQYTLEMSSKGLKVRLYRTTNTIWCHFYVDSKIWHKWTYLWNRLTDTENRLVVIKGKKGVM